mmetsp:Transcript_23732/g.72537  ORF Transcript_23732/g.72537 Transcript_23732/m.72537 type:complete len:235 (+) Transcript_23732:1077-1781(+)
MHEYNNNTAAMHGRCSCWGYAAQWSCRHVRRDQPWGDGRESNDGRPSRRPHVRPDGVPTGDGVGAGRDGWSEVTRGDDDGTTARHNGCGAGRADGCCAWRHGSTWHGLPRRDDAHECRRHINGSGNAGRRHPCRRAAGWHATSWRSPHGGSPANDAPRDDARWRADAARVHDAWSGSRRSLRASRIPTNVKAAILWGDIRNEPLACFSKSNVGHFTSLSVYGSSPAACTCCMWS